MPSPLPMAVDALYYATNAFIANRLERAGFPGIRASHGRIFENLGEGATVSALAARAQVTKQTMAALVGGLEKGGYLERVPHPTDGRSQLVRPTARGKRAMSAAYKILTDLVADWERLVGVQSMAAAQKVLSQLVERTRAQHVARPRQGSAPTRRLRTRASSS